MPPSVYNKPFRSHKDLVEHLSQKGLHIPSPPTAETTLKNINYYRFKIYLRPFLDIVTNRYRPPASFDDGLELYRFDNELRDYLFSIIGKLEIKLRSRLDQVVTCHTNNPFWYLDDDLFLAARKTSVDDVRAKINIAFLRSQDDFVNHFRGRYINGTGNGYNNLPPFWIAAELTTLGNVCIFYESLDKSKFVYGPRSNKLDDLAKEFGAINFGSLRGWATGIRDVRNRCAHHSRVWNCNYREPGQIRPLLDQQLLPQHSNRIYLILTLLHVMCKNIGIEAQIKDTINILLNKYTVSQQFMRSTGIPDNWGTDPIWN